MRTRNVVTMGIDVGKECHVEVDVWSFPNSKTTDVNDSAIPRVLYAGKFTEFSELDILMMKYRPNYTVIDHLPDTRSALSFARRFPGLVSLCHYGNDVTTRDIYPNGEMVTVDRTCWLDLALSRFQNEQIALPVNIPAEYKEHIKAMVRMPKEIRNKTLNKKQKYIYVATGPDHFAHARNYSEIALKLHTNSKSLNITESRI